MDNRRDKRKQHYVPRFYLKQFADENKKLIAFDFKQGALIEKPVYYATQCYKDYFYGEDGVWENRLADMEGKWSASVYKAIKGEKLNQQDITYLKEFVLFQRQRTSAENDRSLKEREDILIESAKSIYHNKGWLFDQKAEDYCRARAQEEVSPAENVEIATRMKKYIDDLDVLIVRYDTREHLITSDSPVIVLNPFLKIRGFGYGDIGVAFLLPLSPRTLLILYDGTLFKKYTKIIYHDSTDSDEVEIINKYELIQAERMAYSSEASYLKVNQEIYDFREKEIERNRTQFLGPEGNRLMITQLRGTNYYYEIPYIHLPREYRRIPYNCREMITRAYDVGFERKLSVKYQFLAVVIKPDMKMLPQKTDLKLGCNRMEALAKIYWNSHTKRFGK